MSVKPLVSIVCFANYCRSPVAERVLKKTFGNSIDFISAGISPLAEANMDHRSIEFLESNDYDSTQHNPREINRKIIEKSKLILAMDHDILMSLNKRFSKFRFKIKIFSYQNPRIILKDPYLDSVERYAIVMKDIERLSKELKFDF